MECFNIVLGESSIRRKLFHLIAGNPGQTTQELANQVDASYSTVRYHLGILVERDHIVSVEYRSKSCYTLTLTPDKIIHAARNRDPEGCILELLFEKGPLTGREIAQLIDRDQSTVSYHLSHLEDIGVVDRTREGGCVLNDLVEQARETLQEFKNRNSKNNMPNM